MSLDDAMRVFVQPTITVVGWVLTASWAIRQVNLVHKKNLELQGILAGKNHKRKVYQELLERYSQVASAADVFQSAGSTFTINLHLEEMPHDHGIQFNARELVEPVNSTYTEFCKAMISFKLWRSLNEGDLPLNNTFDAPLRVFDGAVLCMCVLPFA